MWRYLAISSIALLAAGCDTAGAANSNEAKAQVACAEIGVDPGTPAFTDCVSNLNWNMWYQTEGPATR